jgi:hypothetical protein
MFGADVRRFPFGAFRSALSVRRFPFGAFRSAPFGANRAPRTDSSTMQEVRTKLTPRLLVAAGDGTVHAMAQKHLHRPQEIMVFIGGAPEQITKRTCFANDMADVFGIDTAVIAGFDKNAIIEKVVQGPQGFESMWNVCTVMMAFVPTTWKERKYATRALTQTSIADYPSRKEVQMAHYNVSLVNFLYL